MAVRTATATLGIAEAAATIEVRTDTKVGITITGTMTSMTVTFEVSNDKFVTYRAIEGLPLTGTQTAVSTATAVGGWTVNAAGFRHFRVRASTYASGSVVCTVGVDQPDVAVSVAQAVTTDIAHAEDAASASGHVGAAAMFIRQKSPANTSGTDGDYETPRIDGGKVWVKGGPPNTGSGIAGVQFTSADARTTVAITSAPTSTQYLVIDYIILSTLTAMTLELEEETSGTVIIGLNLAANSPPVVLTGLNIKLPTADKKLFLDTDTAGQINVTVGYHSEA